MASNLFNDGTSLLSQEGITQGDPGNANVCHKFSSCNSALEGYCQAGVVSAAEEVVDMRGGASLS